MNFPTLAVAPLAMHVFGISGGDDPAHLSQIVLLREHSDSFMMVIAPAAGVCALHFDVARTAAAELRQ